MYLNISTEQLVPIIFPSSLVHEYMNRVMQPIWLLHAWNCKPVSAGEINFFGGDVVTSGKSETLELESREEDALVIKNYNYEHGII